jgi:hypothetical protein
LRLLVSLAVFASLTAAFFAWQRFLSHDAKVARLVQATLTDPDSAQFKSVRSSASATYTCGEVNAKNRMGGFVGFTPFLVGADGTVMLQPLMPSQSEEASQFIVKIAARADFDIAYAKHCTKQ